jgi:Xaa-Pro aminopeptidase
MVDITWSDSWTDAVFTVSERDRRWAKVRELMDRDGVDVLLCLPTSNNHNRGAASALYLTQLGENSDETAVYFPGAGNPTVFSSSGRPSPKSNWLVDLRPLNRGAGGAALVERLRESRFWRGTIGIAGFEGGIYAHCREAEGEANWGSVEMLRRAFPEATFVSATDLIGEARFAKSEEELDFLRNGAALCDRIHDTIARVARPGVAERHVFAHMMYTSATYGGTFTPMFGWASGRRGDMWHRVEQPVFRDLESDDILLIEIDGRYGGYIAQIDSQFTMGKAHPETKAAFSLAVDAFDRVVELMRPGVTVRELVEAARIEGMGGRGVTSLTMHGRGTGDDGPPLFPSAPQPGILDLVLEENAVMVVKPSTTIGDDRSASRFGDNVVVTPNGGVRLSTRVPQVVECL